MRSVSETADPGNQVVDRFVQEPTSAVDVLFVIDDSASMRDDQAALARELPRFVQVLDDRGVDYHVGVTTTDTEEEATRGRLRSAGSTRFVTPELPDPVGSLTEMIQVGTEGTGTERGLFAAWLVLEANRNRPENQGFARPDASLSTVVVSDEDDESDPEFTPAAFASWYEGLRDSPVDRTFNAVVALASVGGSQRGDRYVTVAEQVGGVVQDIETAQWAGLLEQLGLRSAGLRREFGLSHVPRRVNAFEVTLERGDTVIDVAGVRYVDERNAVVLDVLPEPGDVVVVRYEAW